MISLDYAIDTVKQLPIEQQKMLIDIFYHKHLKKRRKEIVADAKKSIANFRSGKLQPKSVKEIISELRMTLNGADES